MGVYIIAPRFLCVTPLLLTNSLQQVVEGGGEGVILRKPLSLYLSGRSASLLKVKVSLVAELLFRIFMHYLISVSLLMYGRLHDWIKRR
jgi:hypothetical protein